MAPRWTSSAKTGVGTALADASRVWFTLSHGILNEIYYPRLDQACTRDLGLIVTDGRGFFSEEKRHTRSVQRPVAPGVPAYRLDNTCVRGRYRIEKEVTADPRRDAVLQRIRFRSLPGAPGAAGPYRLFALLAPHLGNRGWGNTAWAGDYKGAPMLFAERDGIALALASSVPWRHRSVGYAGASDGWLDLSRNGRLTREYQRAPDGNVALTGEIDLRAAPDGGFVLALGFGGDAAEAGQRALASLQDGFAAALSRYVRQWRAWQSALLPLQPPPPLRAAPSSDSDPPAAAAAAAPDAGLYRVSTAVLRTHESGHAPGGLIASLSIPWGSSRSDDDLGGYHLVWPRDLVEAAGGLLAAGAHGAARRVLRYLEVTQEPDGHWPQCMWLNGTPYWTGLQLDETALPILLVDLARREAALAPSDLDRYWPMVRRAAAYLVRAGPATQEDRWEENAGYTAFTLGATVAALLAAAELAARYAAAEVAAYLRETADAWNEQIEPWTYAAGTDLAARNGVAGYYVRVAPPEDADPPALLRRLVPLRNRPPGAGETPEAEIVSPDTLALVRFGLRAPDDRRILDTIAVVDSLLRVETAAGPCWKRYSGDGYGEHADGAPFDGAGVGRLWPLLTGERAHYELAAGRPEAAAALCRTLEGLAGPGGLLPEQVWDAADVPGRDLHRGRPTGSAMPLVWAHAEYVKLLRSLRDGRVFDRPPQPVQRYLEDHTVSRHRVWRFSLKRRRLPAGRSLRLETLAPALVHWTADAWQTTADTATVDTGLGVHLVDLPTAGLAPGETVRFTFYWPEARRWEGADFAVAVVP